MDKTSQHRAEAQGRERHLFLISTNFFKANLKQQVRFYEISLKSVSALYTKDKISKHLIITNVIGIVIVIWDQYLFGCNFPNCYIF